VKTKSTAGKKANTTDKLRKAYKDWRTYQVSDHYPRSRFRFRKTEYLQRLVYVDASRPNMISIKCQVPAMGRSGRLSTRRIDTCCFIFMQ
jgi:hypothetical protein